MKSLLTLTLGWVLLCGIAPQNGAAQVLPSTVTGKSYIIAFPKPFENSYDLRFPNQQVDENLYFFLYSDRSTTVLITPPGGEGPFSVVLNGGEFKEIKLPTNSFSYVDREEAISGNVYRVRAQHPVLLYCYMTSKFGAEAWSPLPVESWGNEYYASAIRTESVKDVFPGTEFTFSATTKGAPSQILITAVRNNTDVRIEPSDNVAGGGREPFHITLNAGETYMLRSDADTTPSGRYDLGGTRIVADKLIGVISGNTRVSALDDPEMLTANSIKNLMIEALAPVEQHGTEFVFMPTWDARRRQSGLESDEDRDYEYARIYGSSAGTTFGTVTEQQGSLSQFAVHSGSVHSTQFPTTEAHVLRTDQPAQAMMHSSAVVKFNGTTTTWDNYVGSSYLTWSPYMVELTPREQWTNQAALAVPSHPTAMLHYLNLVADADDEFDIYYTDGTSPRRRFPFDKGKIPGTDFVWGTIVLSPGITYHIEGGVSAHFAGFVYGQWRGQEWYRPGGTKEDDKGSSTQARHPSEYEETVALAYGYPLAPQRRMLDEPDILTINPEDVQSGANGAKTYKISISNATPCGIRSIDLSPGSVNTELIYLDVENETDVIGSTEALVQLRPIDPNREAVAELIATDRTGSEAATSYAYSSDISGVEENDRVINAVEVIGPNPTAGSTAVMVTLVRAGQVRVEIINALGQKIALLADGQMNQGRHLLEWNASSVPAGVYFCRVSGGNGTAIRRIVLR